ncbi:MAG: YgiT-type zinc finger protein [Candidatus Hydrogenedentes bacterium]|nr:YgiT-type zinc finger protein [Candidatus Hydrogenedentota bacterium]
MNCSVQGCPGHYEVKLIIHTVTRGGEVLVFEKVPAEVCNMCSDTVLAPQTVRHLEELIRQKAKPEKYAPLYKYA